MYMVPYICLYKTVCDVSYRCIWYPIFVYVRQCVTCLVCIWYPILVYVRQCVACAMDSAMVVVMYNVFKVVVM